jgi:hypothetical protein
MLEVGAVDEGESKMIASLNSCLQVSIESLMREDPAILRLFFLLGMLPGGATLTELESLWQTIQEPAPLHTLLSLLEHKQLVEKRVR